MSGIDVVTERPGRTRTVSHVLLRMSPTKALIVASRIRDMDPEVYEQVRKVIDDTRAASRAPGANVQPAAPVHGVKAEVRDA